MEAAAQHRQGRRGAGALPGHAAHAGKAEKKLASRRIQVKPLPLALRPLAGLGPTLRKGRDIIGVMRAQALRLLRAVEEVRPHRSRLHAFDRALAAAYGANDPAAYFVISKAGLLFALLQLVRRSAAPGAEQRGLPPSEAAELADDATTFLRLAADAAWAGALG